MEIILHKFQRQALFSEKRIVAVIAGLQSGKTFTGALWLRTKISQFPKEPDASYIVAFPTYSIYNAATFPAFMRLFSDIGTMNKSEHIFTLHHGPRIYFRSLDNEWSCEGITNCRGIWLDEGGLVSTQGFINLMGRAAPKEAQIFISTTPYNLNNFLYRDLYEPYKDGVRDDVEVVQFRSCDNPYFPKAEYDRQQKLLDPRMFSMRYNGTFEMMAGLVYADFNYANYADSFKIDKSKFHIYAGVDFGYTDPFAIAVRAISRDGKDDYQIAEYYKPGHTPDELVQICKQHQTMYGIEMFCCDSADPAQCEMLQRAGLPVTPVKKPAGSIDMGISMHQELIRNKKYRVFRGTCPHTEKEYETYQYYDCDPDRPSAKSGKPMDINNHLMDANRYVTMTTQYIRDRQNVRAITYPTHLQRLLRGDYRVVTGADNDW